MRQTLAESMFDKGRPHRHTVFMPDALWDYLKDIYGDKYVSKGITQMLIKQIDKKIMEEKENGRKKTKSNI